MRAFPRSVAAQALLLCAAVLGAAVVGPGCREDRYPLLNAVEPAWVWEGGRATLALHGVHLPATPTGVLLLGPVTQPLQHVQGVSTRLVLATLTQGLPPGHYGVEVSFAGWPRATLPDALEVRAAPEGLTDMEGPDVWLSAPDPSMGVRAGVPLWLELEASDPSGVRWIGYETTGRLESSAGRAVSSGGDEASTRLLLPVPADLQPLNLFWVIPIAEDRLGNRGAATYAASIVICGDAGDGSPVWECQN